MKNTAEIKKVPASSRLERGVHLFSEGVCILTFIVGAAVWVGWIFDIGFLKSVFPGLVAMKANTAFCFMLAGVALKFSQPERGNIRSSRVISQACFFIISLVGLLTLSEYLFGRNFGIDQLLFKEPAGAVRTINLGRMAPDTAMCFVLFAVGSWIAYGTRKNRTLILTAGSIAGLMLIVIALTAVLSYSFLGFILWGWWNLTPMALNTAIIFLALGVVIILEMLRKGLTSESSRFSKNILVAVTLVITLTIVFVLYVQSTQQENDAEALRYQSFLLADELRQSSDDLTRMVRTYVVTGDPVYKKHYEDILEIRNGKKNRPVEYWRIYWDLVLAGSPIPRPESRQSISLLELMRQTGFTKEEFQKVAEANANSDRLTALELEAMKRVESVGPESKPNREKAIQMLHDKNYHQAKFSIMKPIDECVEMIDRRTLATVKNVHWRTGILQWMFITLGLGLTFMLFRTYAALREILGDSLDNVYAHIRKIGTGDFSSLIEIKQSRKNSVMGWLLQTQTKLRDYHDERKKAEEKLALAFTEVVKSREIVTSMLDDNNQVRARIEQEVLKFESILSSTGDGIFGLDGEGKHTFANTQALKILDYEQEELIGKSCHVLWHHSRPDGSSYPESECPTYAALRDGKTRSGEEYFWRKDGTGFPVEFTIVPIEEDGKTTGAVVSFRDITERKKAEGALLASEREFRSLAESMPQIVWITRADGWNIYFNKKWTDYTGLTLEESYGHGWSTPFHPDDKQRAVDLWQRAVELKDVYAGEFRLRRADGVYRWWLLRGVPQRDESGKILKWFGTCTDVDDIRRAKENLEAQVKDRTLELELSNRKLMVTAEELKRASTAKSEFLANMSHELRTPLGSIIGFSEVIYDEKFGALNERQKEYAENVLTSGRHLLSLINDILDFSTVESGKMVLEVSLFSVKDCLEEVLRLADGLAFSKKINPALEIPEDLGEIRADVRKVKQVIFNIMSNAIKFTPAGGKIGLRARRDDSGIEIAVWDTGIGIPSENLEKVFEAFTRLVDTYTQETEGTGLGLTISRKIVELHGGKMWIESAGVGKGTTVKFTLPGRGV